MRILLVEDNRTLADWLVRALQDDRYTIDCVYNGADADHLLCTQNYGLVILDLALPKLDGREVLRRLRKRSAGADTDGVRFARGPCRWPRRGSR
jgi:two-component system, OmpR family, response regulator TctD